jgi:hypothetical protein
MAFSLRTKKGRTPHKAERAPLKKGRSPYKMLLLTALVLPCANVLVLGTLMMVTYYFGNFYAYTAGGTVLTVLYEIISSLYAIIRHSALILTLMTVGSSIFRYGTKKGLLSALFAAGMSLFEVLANMLMLTFSVAIGVSDSTLALPNQLLLLLPVSALRVLEAIVVCLLAVPVYLLAKTLSQKAKAEESPQKISRFMAVSFAIIGLYTAYLFIDPITVVLTPATGGNFFNNHILPLIYPLIYGGFMVLSAVLFSDALSSYYKYRILAPRGKKEKP